MAHHVTNKKTVLTPALPVTNPHAKPRVTRVVVNAGVGKNRDNKAFIAGVIRDLALITGQAPQIRRARQAISGFSVRQGDIVGYRVTLRGTRMTDFITRFVSVALPRVRDFRGLAESSLDQSGNLSVGLKEQLAFPEIRPEATDAIFGIEVTFVTSATTREQGLALFRAHAFPLTADLTDEVVGRRGKVRQPTRTDRERAVSAARP